MSTLSELPRDERLLLMRFVCSFAWADHRLEPRERELVSRLVRRLGLDEADARQVDAWLEDPPAPATVDPEGIPAEHRMLFLRAIESIVSVDGDVSPDEREALLRFARLGAPRPGSHARAVPGQPVKARVEIRYCTQCRWLLRAAWLAQELLTTFEPEISELLLVPGTGGVFEVRADGELLWSRQERGRFPELKELKQLVRDRIAPDKALGHSERETPPA